MSTELDMATNVRQAGQELRQRRERLRMTQLDVEKRSGVPNRDLSRLETGNTLRPSMDTLVAIGAVLGMTPNDIAELYDYWHPKVRPANIPLMDQLADLMNQLRGSGRTRVEGMLQMVLRAAEEELQG